MTATDTLTRRPSGTKGPLVLLDMDQQALDAAYDQSKYAPNREQVQARRGLEWPIVMPVNTMTQIKAPESAVLDRGSGRFYCPVFGAKPTGYEAARNAEKAELDRERTCLWYVAATRARELLILPRLDAPARGSPWIALLDLSLAELPALALGHLSPEIGPFEAGKENAQARGVFTIHY